MRIATATLRLHGDYWVALASVALIGCGGVVALAGAAAGTWTWATVGAAAAGAGVVVVLAANWIPALGVLAISLPLPAVFSGETARISPAAIVSAAVLLAWLINRSSFGRRIDIGRAPLIPMFAVLAAVAISGLFARHPVLAVREMLNWILLLGLLIAAADLLIERPGRMTTLLLVHAGVTAIVGALAVAQTLGAIPGEFQLGRTGLNRASLGFGQPNGLGMYLAISLPLLVHVAREAATPGRRFLAGGGVIACGLGLIATFSRGSWLAFLLSTMVVFVLGERRGALRIALLASVAAIAVDLASVGAITGRIAGTTQDGMLVQRLALTLAGLLMLQANPIVGVGAGGFGEALEEYGPRLSVLSEYLGSAHNGYVHMAAETGILGLVALLMFVAAGFRILWTGSRTARGEPPIPPHELRLHRSLLWSFSIFALVSLAEWPFAHGIGQIAMLVLAGGLALERSRGRGTARP